MSLDVQKFLNAQLSPRQAGIPVPALAAFFAEGEPHEWIVRGLTAAELARTHDAAGRGEKLKTLIAALAGNDGDKAQAIRDGMGLSDDTPEEISRRIEILLLGSVQPALGDAQRDVAVKLAESFPILFYELTNKIQHLTGEGAEVGKPKRSGKPQASAPP